MWLPALLIGCALGPQTPTRLDATTAAPEQLPPAWHAWKDWRPQLFPGKRPTRYEFGEQDGHAVVLASADRSVSVLRKNQRVLPDELNVLQFSWKVPQLIAQANLAQRDKADSPVRLVLAFDGDRSRFSLKNTMLSELSQALTGEPMPYATLMYVWSNTHAVGEVLHDPNTDRIRKLVVVSGPSLLNQWVQFERDVRADFVRAFGEAPGALLSLGLMTDADNTQSSARAYYGPVAWLKP